jgi:hypothetical protein
MLLSGDGISSDVMERKMLGALKRRASSVSRLVRPSAGIHVPSCKNSGREFRGLPKDDYLASELFSCVAASANRL